MTTSDELGLWFPLVIPGYSTPQRPALHSPAPIGVGTVRVESLRSYLLRMADVHRIAPGTLIQFLKQEYLGRHTEQRMKKPFFKESRICGAGQSAELWVAAVHNATGRGDLMQLTFLPLRHVMPNVSSMSASRRWCPLCVSSHREYFDVYEPLLWCLQTVSACPTHNVSLVSHCGCSGKASRFPSERKLHPGVCPHCGRDLTSVEGTAICTPAPANAAREAKLAADLLLLGQQERIGPAAKTAFVEFLGSAGQQLDEGGRRAFARRLGSSPGQLKGWMDGRHKLTLRSALHIIATVGADVESAFITGVYVAKEPLPTAGTGGRKRRIRQRTEVDWPRRLAALVEAQREEPPPSLAFVGRKAGVAARTLREKWPEHCRIVTQRYTSWKQSTDQEAVQERMRLVREAAEEFALRGIRPTRRRIMEATRITDWKYFKKNDAAASAEATATPATNGTG